MKLGLQGRLTLASLALLAIVGLTSGLWLEGQLRQTLEAQSELELRRLNEAAVAHASVALRTRDAPNIDGIADTIGMAIERRVTIIAPDGTVLGDSALDAARLRTIENHADRPEIQLARQTPGQQGVSRRYSATVQTQMLYVAKTLKASGTGPTIRVSVPLQTIDQAVQQLRLMLGLAGLIAIVVSVAMSTFAARLYAKHLDNLARRMRSTVLQRHGNQSDGLDGIAQSMDKMGHDIETLVETLIQERDRFLAVLETMDAAVIALDHNRSITVVNSAARRMLDIYDDPVGKSLIEVVRVPDLVEMTRTELPKTITQNEIRLARPDGNRTVLTRAAPQRMSGGLVMVLHDITEIKHLEAVRQDFVANVSHELRTPVSVIRANAETLINGALSDTSAATEFTQAILRNAERLTVLLADLLDLARMDAGQTELHTTQVDMAECIQRAFDSLQHQADKRDVHLHNAVPADTLVHADPDVVDQVLLNLIGNAIKYGSTKEGNVWIRAQQSKEHVRFEVVDDGPGIQAQHRARIFERFYRVDPGRSRDEGGTGLGLSIVKHLINIMNGSVGVEPNPGGGTLFWFDLPRK